MNNYGDLNVFRVAKQILQQVERRASQLNLALG